MTHTRKHTARKQTTHKLNTNLPRRRINRKSTKIKYCKICNAVTGIKEAVTGIKHGLIVDLPPVEAHARKTWETRSLIGEVKDLDTLDRLVDKLAPVWSCGFNLKYVGG